MKKKEETITLTTRIPLSTYTQIAIIAERDKRSMNSLINKIIDDYLNKNVKK